MKTERQYVKRVARFASFSAAVIYMDKCAELVPERGPYPRVSVLPRGYEVTAYAPLPWGHDEAKNITNIFRWVAGLPFLLLVLVGCSTPPDSGVAQGEVIGEVNGKPVSVFHDNEGGVTCYVVNSPSTGAGLAISCLPMRAAK